MQSGLSNSKVKIRKKRGFAFTLPAELLKLILSIVFGKRVEKWKK